MSDREQDKRVAEILGYTVRHYKGHGWTAVLMATASDESIQLPRYTTDPAADYKVLEWVRYNYRDSDDVQKRLVWEEFYDQTPGDVCEYEPGTFSLTLLELDEQGLLK